MAAADGDGAGDRVELASPPCTAEEADDAYMGFAPRAELLGFCLALRQALPGIAAAGEVGDLLDRAIAILRACGPVEPPPREPLPFGAEAARQALRTILPRVRDDRLHALLCQVRQRLDRDA